MLLFLKVSFQEKIPPWLFHHKLSNSSGGDMHRAQIRNADGALGNRAPYLPADHPWSTWKAGAWGLQPPVPVCKEAIWQQCSHTALGLLRNTRRDDFPCLRMSPGTFLLAQEILQVEGQGKLSVDRLRCFCTPCICLSLSSCWLTTSLP